MNMNSNPVMMNQNNNTSFNGANMNEQMQNWYKMASSKINEDPSWGKQFSAISSMAPDLLWKALSSKFGYKDQSDMFKDFTIGGFNVGKVVDAIQNINFFKNMMPQNGQSNMMPQNGQSGQFGQMVPNQNGIATAPNPLISQNMVNTNQMAYMPQNMQPQMQPNQFGNQMQNNVPYGNINPN